jgi:lysozyme
MINEKEKARLKAILIFEEGKRSLPYDDATGSTINLNSGGKITIGVGRNLNGNPLTDEEIDFLLENDIKTATRKAVVYLGIKKEMHECLKNMAIQIAFCISEKTLSGKSGSKAFYEFVQNFKEQEFDIAVAKLRLTPWAQSSSHERVNRIAQTISNITYVAKYTELFSL